MGRMMAKTSSDSSLRTDSFYRDARESLKNHEFWLLAAWLEIVSKYRRSAVGIFWVLLPPVATFCVLGYFYAGIIGRPPLSFMPYMGMGYTLWRFVTQVMNEASTVMLSSRAFIMDGRVRLTDYVLKSISKAAFHLVAACIVLGIVLACSPDFVVQGLPVTIAGLALFMWNLFCLAIVLALVGARFPDFHELTTSVFIFGFLLTPILWYPDSLPAGSARSALVMANPVYHFLEIVRGPVLGRQVAGTSVAFVALFTAFTTAAAALVYRRYARFVPIWI
ncbi:ABC transporter permease [Luteimonas colneyensis]|nr:ABC transporter permease [Luteimonas colneyensis]